MSKMEKKINTTQVYNHMIRILLRSIPFAPAPELFDLFQDLASSRTAIDQKITKAANSLQETSKLIAEIDTNLKERTQKLSSLRQEYERYSALAEIEEDKAKMLVKQFEITLNKGRRRDWLISLLISLVAGLIIFGIGILLGPIITGWIGK